MDDHVLQKLEFFKIREMLRDCCITSKGKDLAQGLRPCNKKDAVLLLLSETQEAISLVFKNAMPPFSEISDITVYLKEIEISASLPIKALLELAYIFKIAQDLKCYFFKDYILSSNFPMLGRLFDSLYTNPSIMEKVFSSIMDENTLEDNASKNLSSIRRKKRKLEQDIRFKLNDMIHSSSFSKYIQDPLVTIKNDRFVIPVKEEYRSFVKGFVHDVSNAGSTIFIEPISVFEMNNSLNELLAKEELEIEKILQQLTALFAPYLQELKIDVETISQLDFIFAKAKLAKNLQAIIPKINDKKEIYLHNARHPLIDKEKVVPITLSLGCDFSVLLITGPNTGGKTVTLKTVGLLTCMACSGLAIPAEEGSSVYVFDYVFADIGDDQSISDSLSTFSSHMANIVSIVGTATSNSLVLVDELGSGTDPLEGANLAISILEDLAKKSCLTMATTHYQELKQYALITDGFENASVEFDINTLSPTYRLLIGVPGKSNAFEISKKLGLPNKIIEKAKSRMSNEQIHMEDLLKHIYDEKSLLEKEKLEIETTLAEVSNLKTSLVHDNETLKKQEQELINNAKIKARNILLEAKEESNEIIKHMNEVSESKELQHLRNQLNQKIKEISIEPFSTSASISSNRKLDKKEIQPNTQVFVTTLNQNGTVLSHVSKSNEVQIQVGNLKMNVSIKNLAKPILTKSTKKEKNVNSTSSYTSISKTKNAKTEINVIGYNVEEALFVVDKFLDDSSLAKLQTVRIVHGKGTGKLRDGIHQFLRKHPHVKSFRLGLYGEGEMGVTVVTLK